MTVRIHYSIICLLVTASVLGQASDDNISFLEPLNQRFNSDAPNSCEREYTGARGKCIPLNDCDYAKDLLRPWIQAPQICGFNGSSPLVCCPLKTPFTGQRCEKQCAINRKKNYFTNFYNPVLTVGYGGTKAKAREFNHMALLGYGNNTNNNEDDNLWLCGGSLISKEFVLTAAHCLFARDFGPVRRVRLGELNIKDSKEDAKPQDFNVSKVFSHPKYQSLSHYHDIALIKLDRPALYNEYVRPGCLHVRRNVPPKLSATGWGKLHYLDNTGSNDLIEVKLTLISHESCVESYAKVGKRRLRNGIIDDSQICAGNVDGQDTCPGDSGGPLQFKHPKQKFYYIVGVTSFGKACGIANSMGVYTRVSSYIDWIEDIVWPLESKNMIKILRLSVKDSNNL